MISALIVLALALGFVVLAALGCSFGFVICLLRGHDFIGHIYQVCWRCGKIEFDQEAWARDLTLRLEAAVKEYYKTK